MTPVLFIEPKPQADVTGDSHTDGPTTSTADTAGNSREDEVRSAQPWFQAPVKKVKAPKKKAAPEKTTDGESQEPKVKAEAVTRHSDPDAVITLTYKYNCPAWFAGRVNAPPRKEGDTRPQFPQDWEDQIWLAHRLNNDLVACEHSFMEMWSALKDPKPGDDKDSPAVDSPEAADVGQQENLPRVNDSEKFVGYAEGHPGADNPESVKSPNLSLILTPDEKEQLRAQLKEQKKGAPTQLRREAVEKGLYWSTATMVLRGHRTAQKLIHASWKNGRPARRGFKRYDGSGTLHTQIMWNNGMPLPTPANLMAPKSPWRNTCRIEPFVPEAEWTRPVKATVHLRLSPGGKMYPVPILMDRPLPADCDITEVRLVRKKVGEQYRMYVCFGINLPKPPAPVDGETVAVKIGWKSLKQDGVRVATIATASGNPLPPPPKDLAKFIRVTDGNIVEVVAPRIWQELLDRDDRIHGHRDTELNQIRDKVVETLRSRPQMQTWLQEQGVDVSHIHLWRSPGRMQRLARIWPSDDPFKPELVAWIRREWHLHQYEAHERDGVSSRRRHVYRLVGAWLGGFAKEIVISGTSIAPLKQSKEDEDPAAKAIRRNMYYASPGDLRAMVERAAYRRNIPIIHVTTEKTKEGDQS